MKILNFFKCIIKGILLAFGYRIRRIDTCQKSEYTSTTNTRGTYEEPVVALPSVYTRKKPLFADRIYTPTWRLRNYYALKEFGPQIKRWFIEQRYYHVLNKFPDLDNPKTFNEKIHWLNLNYHNPLITRCCDKYELKYYITEQIGEQYVVPVLKTYKRASEIHFSELPEQFVIKANWGDGPEFLEIIKDKSIADENAIKFKFNNAIQPWNNLYYSHFFWGYKNVKPVIYAEKYIEHKGSDLDDFKFHCFNGVPKFVLVCEDRTSGKMKKTFLDLDWKIMPCYRADGEVNRNVKKPENFDEMLNIVNKLCKPFPFVRVDLYNVEGQLYVGEMTFHPGCALENFIPEEYNYIVGDMLKLPEPVIEADEHY